MSPKFIHPDLVRDDWTAFTRPRHGTQLGLGQSSSRFGSGSLLGSRIISRLETGLIGSTWLDARLSLRLGSFQFGTRLGLARLGSARLGWLLGVRLTSALGSGSVSSSGSGVGNQLDARFGSARNSESSPSQAKSINELSRASSQDGTRTELSRQPVPQSETGLVRVQFCTLGSAKASRVPSRARAE